MGSAVKVVDCILALKSYHEWKQMNCGNGPYKQARSPMVTHSAGGSSQASATITSDSCRRLDMSAACEKQLPTNDENQKLEGCSLFHCYITKSTCCMGINMSQELAST